MDANCPLRRTTILVIDDEPDILLCLTDFLTSMGYGVITAEDGEKGMQAYNEHHPQIILSDIKMPKMDGLEFLRQFKKAGNNAEVIMITGHGMMDNAITCLNLGAFRYINKPIDLRELQSAVSEAAEKSRMKSELELLLRELTNNNENLERKVFERTAELRQLNEKLEQIAITDELTGAYNRRHFLRRLEEYLAQAQRYSFHLCLIMLDIDDFKKVNDSFGHQAGDKVLMELSGLIQRCLRRGEVFARYGGEEFALVLPHTDRESALIFAERIRGMTEANLFSGMSEKSRVTISLGIADATDCGMSPEEIIRRADAALYMAKRNGKNTVCCWGSEMLKALEQAK